MASPAQRLQAERLSYPGMLLREIIIWRNWLRANEPRFERYDYNLRVGKGVDPGAGFPEEIRRDGILNSQRRIDAIGFRAGRATLIEVEENPGLSAVGQLLGYKVLWQQDNPAELPPELLMVAARASDDAKLVIFSAGIALDLVLTDFSELRRQT